jgi:energy-coupling factor transport system substrate-specific component
MKRLAIFDQLLRPAIYISTTLLGILALIYPFLFPAITQSTSPGKARSAEMPIMLTALVGLALLVLLYEVQGDKLNTRMIALLGILIAINSTLRFIEVGIPGPGGFSPIFFLIILTGYLFGGSFGFLMGSLTLFVSALMTGGIGPWLPSQMFAAGWVGMSAALLPPLINWLGRFHKYSNEKWERRIELGILMVFGFLWGLLYGVIMNLWSWPYFSGPADQFWTAGIGTVEIIQRYLSYYLLTSLVWDIARGIGTVLILLAFGIPVLRALRRFHSRFSFQYSSTQDNILTQETLSQENSSIPTRGQI